MMAWLRWRMLRTASWLFVGAVVIVSVPSVVLHLINLIWLWTEVVSVIRGLRGLSTAALTLAMWFAWRAFWRRGARLATPGGHAGGYRTSATDERGVAAVQPEGSWIEQAREDVAAACLLLGSFGIMTVTPFVASRASSLLCGAMPMSAVTTDPSVVVGVPILVVSWLLIALQGRVRQSEGERCTAWVVTAGLWGCAAWLLWIATGKVRLAWCLTEASILKGIYQDADTLPDLVGGHVAWMAHGASGMGPFMTRVPPWAATLAVLVGAYALLVAMTAAVATRVTRTVSRNHAARQ